LDVRFRPSNYFRQHTGKFITAVNLGKGKMTRRSAGTTRRHATPEYDAHFHFTDLEPALLQRHAQFLGRIARTAGYCYKCCDVAWSVSLSVCVGRTASPAKTFEQIEVLFEGQNRVGSRNQVLNGCYVKCFF